MKERNDVVNAMAEATIAYAENGGVKKRVITNEYDLAFLVGDIVEFTGRLIDSSQPLFRLEPVSSTDPWHVAKWLRATKAGVEFLSLIRAAIPDVRCHFSRHRLHPRVDLLIDSAMSRGFCVQGYEPLHPNMKLAGNAAHHVLDALNGCIEEIRTHGRSEAFKRKLDRFARLARKNYQSLHEYIDALAENHARQLVLRIDLGYRKDAHWPCGRDGTGVDYWEVKAHRQQLLRHLNFKLPGKCMTGYALKLEYGLEKGYHYHLMLFLDGAKVREDVTIAKLIGEHWNAVITEGRGLYHNCNAFKSGYKQCGIGVFHHADAAMREGLKKAALYLTKQDSLIQLVVPDDDRTFWKGVMPAARSGRGRPRTKAVISPVLEMRA